MSETNSNKQFKQELDKATETLKQSALDKLISKLKDQFKEAGEEFTKTFSLTSGLKKMISQTKEALSELKEIDTLLTQISKNNTTLSKSQLEAIANNSFDIASAYGKKATDYLNAIAEATNASYQNAESMAKLSLAAQSAGDITSSLANKYIIATDKAYNLGGSVEKLTEILDGSHNITANNSVNLTELAESMSLVSRQASKLGLDANETTALLSAMLATTQYSASETADAFEAILYNIRQVANEENGITTEGLSNYAKACTALNVSLKETQNGVTALRDPLDILKDLAEEYSKLSDNDLRKNNLLNSLDGAVNADVFDALLENYDVYEKMLEEYANGAGSMAEAAEKTANSWDASLNRLSNTWTETVGNVAESDAVTWLLNSLNSILSVVNDVTNSLGSIGTIGTLAGLSAGIKNVGKGKLFPFNHRYMF